MVSNKKKKFALIHVAKKAVRLDDEAYRALLGRCAGIASLTERGADFPRKTLSAACK